MGQILLTDWARKHGIKPMDAKNMARRGKIEAKIEQVLIKRWVIDETALPPQSYGK
jgi:hypothetical protein